MADPSKLPALATGSRNDPKPLEPPNDAGALIHGVPTWWHPHRMPEQVAKTVGYLETVMGPKAYAKKPRNGILLYGEPGTGKTSSGCGLIYLWAKAGFEAHYEDSGELMVRVKSAWRKEGAQTVEQIHAELMRPKILFLDDLARQADADAALNISVIINARINRGKPTVAATNCNLDTELGREQFKAGADSRVLERYSGCVVDTKDHKNLRRPS